MDWLGRAPWKLIDWLEKMPQRGQDRSSSRRRVPKCSRFESVSCVRPSNRLARVQYLMMGAVNPDAYLWGVLASALVDLACCPEEDSHVVGGGLLLVLLVGFLLRRYDRPPFLATTSTVSDTTFPNPCCVSRNASFSGSAHIPGYNLTLGHLPARPHHQHHATFPAPLQ